MGIRKHLQHFFLNRLFNKRYLFISGILFAGVSIGALIARTVGWYNDYWFTDIILHTISGIALALAWMGIQRKEDRNTMLVIGSISFATFGSVLWEFWEYAGYLITRSSVPFYIPQLSDTLGDISCGMISGLCIALFLTIRKSN